MTYKERIAQYRASLWNYCSWCPLHKLGLRSGETNPYTELFAWHLSLQHSLTTFQRQYTELTQLNTLQHYTVYTKYINGIILNHISLSNTWIHLRKMLLQLNHLQHLLMSNSIIMSTNPHHTEFLSQARWSKHTNTFPYIRSITDKSYNTITTLPTESFPSSPSKQSLKSQKSKAKSPCTLNSTEIIAIALYPHLHTPSTTSSPSSLSPTTPSLH